MAINIFVDSDGVIYDFCTHVMNHLGCSPNAIADDDLWPRVAGIPDFWSTMPLLPWAHDLLAFLAPYHPCILTGCPQTGYAIAAQQKLAKYAIQFPGLPVITCRSRDKPAHLKAAGDILLDDRDNNFKRWRKAGGQAVLFRTYEQAVTDLTGLLQGNPR